MLAIKEAIVLMKVEAALQSGTNTHAATAGTLATKMGVTGDGAAKALLLAANARDSDTKDANFAGSGYMMASTRAQSTTAGEEWKTNWTTPTKAAMISWTGRTDHATNKVAVWWALAREVVDKADLWHTKY
jgi:hypothetical protein